MHCAEDSIPVRHASEQGHREVGAKTPVEIRNQKEVWPLQKKPSPIKVDVMEEWLKAYPRKGDATYLLNGF